MIADAHLDLAYLADNGRDLLALPDNGASGWVTLPTLRAGGVELVLATIFTEARLPDAPHGYVDRDDREGAERAAQRQLAIYLALERDGHVRIVRTAADLDGIGAREPGSDARRDQVPLPIVILMEGADPIRTPGAAEEWFRAGVRVVGLSWTYGSRYAGGNGCPGGLTAEGRELVAAFDDLGMVHDVSHLSDEAFDELLGVARGRVLATHSNCRALLRPIARHLRDAQVRAIVERDGLVGLNLYGAFLAIDRRATIDDCLRHLDHVTAIAGRRDVVCLGSDMDGGFPPDQLPDALERPEHLPRLLDALRRHGWSERDVDGFARENLLRFLRQALPR